MLVLFPEQCNEIAGIRNGVHYSRENPLRDETSRGPPLITPANSSSGFFSSRERELSTACRTTRPTGNPVRRDFWRSRSIRSGERRTVIVLLICQDCNTCNTLRSAGFSSSRPLLVGNQNGIPGRIEHDDASARPAQATGVVLAVDNSTPFEPASTWTSTSRSKIVPLQPYTTGDKHGRLC